MPYKPKYKDHGVNSAADDTVAWLRIIDELQAGNILLKQHLSIVAWNAGHSREALELLEHFQNSFLNCDADLALLRKEIFRQQKNAVSEDAGPEFMQRQMQLHTDISKTQASFAQLKASFNSAFAAALT